MSNWFAPKMPKISTPPPPPQIDQAMTAFNQEQAMLLKKRGPGTDILTSPQGLPNLGTTRAPTLTGASAKA